MHFVIFCYDYDCNIAVETFWQLFLNITNIWLEYKTSLTVREELFCQKSRSGDRTSPAQDPPLQREL